jgi:hypothetical protein
MQKDKLVPAGLKFWFIVHFVADITFAVPLMFFPEVSLKFAGWQAIDPVSARICAAALFGIGIESLLCRNASLGTFNGMLGLKIIWSLAAIVGFALSLIQNAHGRPLFLWMALFIFVAFNILWVYWKLRVMKIVKSI